MSKFYLPTYEECVLICKSNENFFEKKTEVNGLQVSVFNYRLATLSDFIAPLGESSPIQATELRGITFVHNPKTGKAERNLMLHKFFNIDQTEGYMLSQIQHKKIIRSQDKADGSMIRFVKVGDKILAKTKVSFENDQAAIAQNLMEKNSKIKSFVEETIEKGLSAIFEFVSPMNQIVLVYGETKLVLLQLRDETSGEYLDIYSNEIVKKHGVELVKSEEIQSFDFYMEGQKTVTDREGWVLTLQDENGLLQLAKRKTQWYMDRHGLLTEGLARENHILAMILNETIDDAMALVVAADPRRKYAEEIQKRVAVYLEKSLKEVKEIMAQYNGVRKDFALKFKDTEWFSVAVKHLDVKDEEKIYSAVKDRVLYQTKNLMEAKDFVAKTLGVQLMDLIVDTDS